MKRSIRILHAPTTVGGNPQGLCRAEQECGLNSTSVSIYQNYLGYKTDVVLDEGSSLKCLLNRLYWGLFKSQQFDIIHYNFGSSFLPFRINPLGKFAFLRSLANFILSKTEFLDLKLAYFLGRKIFITFQGDDIRQGDFCRKKFKIHYAHYVDEKYYSPITDEWKRERIRCLSQYADKMFALNPDLLYLLPAEAEFLPYGHINLSDWKFIGTKQDFDFIPHIIHAPSNRLVKGTHILLSALSQLEAEGIKFKFTLVEGLNNQEARKIYEDADLLVDQLLAGFYGGLSVELMALGKPVICYLRQEDLLKLPEEMHAEIPIINATPENIYDVLKEWLTLRRRELYDVGVKSRKYVEKRHNSALVAEKMKYYYFSALNMDNF